MDYHRLGHCSAAVCRLRLIGDLEINRRLSLYVSVLALAVTFIQIPVTASKQEPTNVKKSEEQVLKAIATPKLEQIVDLAVSETTDSTTPKPVSAGSCEEAIAAVWPAALQDGARLVSMKESSMIADRIGPLKADGTVGYNYDGSRDYGCFQINDKAHPDFFANGDWRDPTYNAQYALKTYNERGNWTAWYAVRGILW